MFLIFVGASHMLGRALTSTIWGMVADRIGRKPVIVFGIFFTLEIFFSICIAPILCYLHLIHCIALNILGWYLILCLG